MKNKIKWIVIGVIFVALLLSILIGVISQQKEKVVLKENVYILDKGTAEEQKYLTCTENTIVFNNNPEYAKDDVLVSGITESAPNGFIRRVVEVKEENGQYVIYTETALLTDVFEEAHIRKQLILTEDEVIEKEGTNTIFGSFIGTKDIYYASETESKESMSKVPKKKVLECDFDYQDNDSIIVDGDVDFDIWLDVELEVEDEEVSFSIIAHNKANGEVSIICSSREEGSFEIDVLEKRLPNFQFMAGVVPIVITNEIAINVEGETHIEGSLENTLYINAKNEVGFAYDSKSNKLKEVKKNKYNADGLEWKTEEKVIGGESASINLHLVSKLYDCSGADISIGLKESFEGQIGMIKEEEKVEYIGSADMWVAPVLSGSLVVDTPIIHKNLVEATLFDVELEPFWEKHWESSKNWKERMDLLKNIELRNTYVTRYDEVNNLDAPIFEFAYPDNWNISVENVDSRSELVSIINERGAKITYADGVSLSYGGHRETIYRLKISKVTDSKFQPDNYLLDSEDPYGAFIVAKVKAIGSQQLDTENKISEVDGPTYYAILPESVLGEMEVVGLTGIYEACSFVYHGERSFIAEAPNGIFTVTEEAEVIEILASFW